MKHPNQVDFGLKLSGCSCVYGVPKSSAEIAAWCNWNPTTNKWTSVSRQRIEQIEKRALKKLRRNPQTMEWVHSLQKHEVHY